MDYFRLMGGDPPKPFPVDKGLPREQVLPGMLVSVSASKLYRDRSYGDIIWKVIGVTPHEVLIEATDILKPAPDYFRGPHKLSFQDREFYDAEPLVRSMQNERTKPTPTNP